MEGETKKRKMEYIEKQEKEKEDDEEKMQKFFALLRSTKEMHDHMRIRNSNGMLKEREDIKKVEEEKVSVAWNPSFQPEDFLEDGKDGGLVAGPSKSKDEEKKDEEEEGTDLDLKLSL